MAPPRVMVLIDMRLANNFPPTHAAAVQSPWPTIAPMMTYQYSDPAAMAMVAIWDSSPHSPKNVITNTWMKMGDNTKDAKSFIWPANSWYQVFLLGSGSKAAPDSAESRRSLRSLDCISSSTSANSSSTPTSFDISKPSSSNLAPKTTKRTDAKNWVSRWEIKVGNAWPTIPDKTVITANDENAAVNTSTRLCFMAINAAIKKVLSPISETTIIEIDMRNALYEGLSSSEAWFWLTRPTWLWSSCKCDEGMLSSVSTW